MTKNIAVNHTTGASTAIPIESGQYTLAVSGTFDGAIAALAINVGKAEGCPVEGATFTTAGTKTVWLPNCTCYVTLTTAGGNTDVNAAIAELSSRLE